jgi:RsiW-degrading membrane proteinase PrsW (M82 family)
VSGLDGAIDLAILILAALLPALLYLSWVRSSEGYMAESWGPLLRSFLYGALFATLVSALLELILLSVGTSVSQAVPAPEFSFLNGRSTLGQFFLVLVVAPLVEESLKATGVIRARRRFRVVSDGPVVGASVGLGFGFFETFLYGLGAFLTGGLVAGLGLILVRSVSSVLLHGSTTGMFGFGYAESSLRGYGHLGAAYFLLAVAMHAGFNVLASSSALLQAFGISSAIAQDASLLALGIAIVYAFAAIVHVRTVISQTTFPGAAAGTSRFRPPPVRTAPGIPPRSR